MGMELTTAGKDIYYGGNSAEIVGECGCKKVGVHMVIRRTILRVSSC